MKPKLAVVFSLLLLTPLAAVTWLGLKTAGDEQEMVRHRFEDLLSQRLADVSGQISAVVEDREREVAKLLDMKKADAEVLRERVRTARSVQQIFVVGADGKMIHPPLNSPRNDQEEAFLQRTEHIWKSQESFFHPDDAAAGKGKVVRSAKEVPAEGEESGWYTWYWGNGINFIYWRRDVDGRILGAQLDRLTLLSDIVAKLPETSDSSPNAEEGRIELLDSDGNPVYIWGKFEPEKGSPPTVSTPLAPPLGAWRLRYHASPELAGKGTGESMVFGILASLAALLLAMIALAVYFVRETGRDAGEAKKRVTFVNQVSHELKTPLTNIRMYAELLEDQIDEEDEQQRKYLDVIVSESQRLSRLIGNVLSFARKAKKKLILRTGPGRLDEAVAEISDQFSPGLEAAGIEMEVDLAKERSSTFDKDALGQILGNLLSNVEKYAAKGAWVRISSSREGDMAIVTVSDRGPGVPRSAREDIFKPFFRLADQLTEGAAGTGIGLAISRDLARLHGGDLVLLETDKGTSFELRISAPIKEH